MIPLALRPMIRNARRLFAGPDTLESAPFDKEILYPEERAELPAPQVLPGQIEKITGCPIESTIETELDHALRREVAHAPTIAYHIRDAALIDGSIYAGKLRHYVTNEKSDGSFNHISKAALVSTPLGAIYFAHWLRDECSMYMLAEKFGEPLVIRAPHYSDAPTYAGYFEQEWLKPVSRAVIDDLTVFQDYSQNTFKRKRYEKLRSRAVTTPPRRDRLIYFRRGSAGVPRLIADEESLIAELVKHDFEVIDVGASIDLKLSKFSEARMVISMEGSHCGHCLMSMPVGSSLLILQPADRFCGMQRGWANCLSIKFGFVIGQRGATGYRVSTTDILRTADLMH